MTKPVQLLSDTISITQARKQKAASFEAAFGPINTALVKPLCDGFIGQAEHNSITELTDQLQTAADSAQEQSLALLASEAALQVDQGIKPVYGMSLD
jgi:hypothetical protein